MTTPITDVDGFGPCVTVVNNVDPADAATMLALLQPLANRTFHTNNRCDGLDTTVATKANRLTVTAVKTGAYTAAIGELVRVDTSGGAVTITLPTAASVAGKPVVVKKTDAGTSNDVTISPNGSETIDGASSATITASTEPRGSRTLVSDGTNWLSI